MPDPFPPYSYVPRKFPHPLRDPHGHSYASALDPCPPAQLADWRKCPAYLRGVQLFNRGFYWESHETWEAVWLAAGRTGVTGDFVKGLIKLAAAGVKAREGRPEGVRRHALRARQLFQQVRRQVDGERTYFGLDVDACETGANWIAEHASRIVNTSDEPVVIVIPFKLVLDSSD